MKVMKSYEKRWKAMNSSEKQLKAKAMKERWDAMKSNQK